MSRIVVNDLMQSDYVYELNWFGSNASRSLSEWRAMSRHISQVKKNCEQYNFFCRPRQRQALLHWAYDSRQY